MTWDIQDGKAEEYVEFAVGELVPAFGRLGLNLTDAWYTWVGAGPQIVVAGWLPEQADAERFLNSAEFLAIKDRLLQYVANFRCKIRTAGRGELPF